MEGQRMDQNDKRELWYCVEGVAMCVALFLVVLLGAFISSGCVVWGQTEEDRWRQEQEAAAAVGEGAQFRRQAVGVGLVTLELATTVLALSDDGAKLLFGHSAF